MSYFNPMALIGGGMGSSKTRWQIDSYSYSGLSADPSSEDTFLEGLSFKDDGTKMYVSGNQNEKIYQYTLSSPWDVSSASYDSKSLDLSSTLTNPSAIYIKQDGITVYVCTATSDTVYQYTLSTPWDISTGAYASKSLDVNAEHPVPQGLFFRPDGTSCYICGSSSDSVTQWTLSTPWDISTGAYASKSLSTSSEDDAPLGVHLSPDGLICYVAGSQNDSLYEYRLSTPWDISTGAYSGRLLDVSTENSAPRDLFFNPDGSNVFMVGNVPDRVFQYDL